MTSLSTQGLMKRMKSIRGWC